MKFNGSQDGTRIKYGALGFELTCPNCGGLKLHQLDVYVVDRISGEGSSADVKRIGPRRITFDYVQSFQIPGRRNFLEVSFYCEECCGHGILGMRLRIEQHEGKTRLYWVDAPSEED